MNQNWRAIEIATYYLWTWLEKVTRICENVTVFISNLYRLFIWRNLQLLFIKSFFFFFGENLSKIFLQSQPYKSETWNFKSAKYMLWKKWYMKIDYFCISNLWSTGCAVWEFDNFSANQILREFNFCESEVSKSAIWQF